jgi:hypothetical protein
MRNAHIAPPQTLGKDALLDLMAAGIYALVAPCRLTEGPTWH